MCAALSRAQSVPPSPLGSHCIFRGGIFIPWSGSVLFKTKVSKICCVSYAPILQTTKALENPVNTIICIRMKKEPLLAQCGGGGQAVLPVVQYYEA